MPLTVYFDTAPSSTRSSSAERPESGEIWIALVKENLQNKTAVSFSCVSGAQDDKGKVSFRTTTNTILAKGVCTKADKLNSDAALHLLQVGDTVAFELQAATAMPASYTSGGRGPQDLVQ